jgi:uncharacterized protein (DUF927 family)
MADPFGDLHNTGSAPDPFLLILERCKRDPSHLSKNETDFDLVLRVYVDTDHPENWARLIDRFKAVAGLDIAVLLHALLLKAVEAGEEKAVEEVTAIGLGDRADLLKHDLAAAFVSLCRSHATRWGYLLQRLRDAKVRGVPTFQKAIETEAKKAPPPKSPSAPSAHKDERDQLSCKVVLDGARPGLYLLKDGFLGPRISQLFEVAGIGVSSADIGARAEWRGIVIKFRNCDGADVQMFLSGEMLTGDASKLGSILYRAAFDHDGAESARKALRRYLVGYACGRRILVAGQTGWLEHGGKIIAFVLPNEVIPVEGGGYSADRIILDPDARSPRFAQRGTLEEWRQGAAKLAGEHMQAVFAMSASFSGVLLGLCELEGGGFNRWGGSSGLKTSLDLLASTVWGRGRRENGFMRTWAASLGGTEIMQRIANDLVLFLDDTSQCDPRMLAPMIYMSSGGQTKTRMRSDTSLRDASSFRLLMMSTGEHSIVRTLKEAKLPVKAGTTVRMLDIPALGVGKTDTNQPASALDANEKNWKAFAQKAAKAGVTAYGVAGPEFVRRVVAEAITGKDITASVNAFIESLGFNETHGQSYRGALKFGLVATGGELAIQFGVLPWKRGLAAEAAKYMFELWRARRGTAGSYELLQALEKIQAFFETAGTSRFERVSVMGQGGLYKTLADDRLVSRRAGYVTIDDGVDRLWFVHPGVLQDEIFQGVSDVRSALNELVRLGAIVGMDMSEPDRGPRPGKQNIDGRPNARFYTFTTTVFSVVEAHDA